MMIGNRKEKGIVSTVLLHILRDVEKKPQHPERIDLQQFNSEQIALVSPGIQTWPAQIECICSAAYTITTTMVRISHKLEFLQFKG